MENFSQLIDQLVAHFYSGKSFSTIVQARRFAQAVLHQPVEEGTPIAKQVDEAIESSLVRTARCYVKEYLDPITLYNQLTDLYHRQPRLRVRTSDSVLRQAYSTPIPIAYTAAVLANINSKTTVYEPTAGNGALLLLTSPENTFVNEIDSARASQLRTQGFNVTQHDALSYSLPHQVQAVITNPPFGSKQKQGKTIHFKHQRLTTTQIDHVIALKALQSLSPDGRAVLILGSKLGDDEERAKRYSSQLTRGFYHWLYRDSGFHVRDHFSIAGNLYLKQGAGYPIDVILIEGRGETHLKVPAIDVPRMYSTYNELKEVLVNAVERNALTQQAQRNSPISLQPVPSRSTLDSATSQNVRSPGADLLDKRSAAASPDIDPDRGRVFIPSDTTIGMVDRSSDRGVVSDVYREVSQTRDTGDRPGDRLSTAGLLGDSDGGEPTLQTMGNVDHSGLPAGQDGLFPPRGSPISDFSVSSTPGTSADDTVGMAGVVHVRPEADINLGAEVMAESVEVLSQTSGEVVQTQVEPDWNSHVDRQVPYIPRSNGFRLDTLSPASAVNGLRQVFDRIEAVTRMSVDDYVKEKLQEESIQSLFDHYAAEQIDSLALCIYNYEYEKKASLVAHDTGLGKTRIIAGLTRYAILNDMIPAIVTADPVLYNDILSRDARDTGNEFNPFFTNNDLKLELKTPDGEVLGEIRTPADHYKTVREYTDSGNIGEYDCILTTYGQLTGSASQDRRALLETLAPRLFLVCDESHKAGGASGVAQKRSSNREQEQDDDSIGDPNSAASVTEFFQALIRKTPGFIASSATAIKDPIVAARLFYETTDLRYAAEDRDTFADHLREGGIPLQQMVFSMWAASGGFIRCQKSYEGIEFNLSRVPVDLQTAEDTSKALNAIWRFDKAKKVAVQEIDSSYKEEGQTVDLRSNVVGEGGAQSTTFTSVLHNLITAYNLAYVSDALADRVIASIESGEKPVIMLFNTMETMVRDFISTYNEDAQLHNLEYPDDPIAEIKRNNVVPIKAGELAMRYLEKSRMVRIIEPYLDPETKKQRVIHHRLTDEELGPYGVELYHRAEQSIAAIPAQIPVSPIDYMKKRVEEAGYSIGEITGRTQTLTYSSTDLSTAVTTFTTRAASTKQKQKVMADFQSGQLDAVITNSTTGYSLHAARSVSDQRRRVMFIPQPNPDINQVEQALGRIFRAGSVNPAIHAPDTYNESNQPIYGAFPGAYGLPRFELIAGDGLPTSERPLAIVQRKMNVLKANTTGDRGSNFEFEGMPNFMDQFGSEVACQLMLDDRMLHADLDYPLGTGASDDRFAKSNLEKAIQKVTGRAPMLVSDDPPTPECPYPSLSRQAWLYNTLAADYTELLLQKQAMGENTLEAQRLDLRARPVQRKVLNPGNPDVQSAFTKPTYLVEVMAQTGRKPYTTLEVANQVRESVGAERIESLEDHDDYGRSDVRDLGRNQARSRVEELTEIAQDFMTSHIEAATNQIAIQASKVSILEQNLENQESTKSTLQEQIGTSVESTGQGSVQQSIKLQTKVTAQDKKIKKLRGQLNEARQTLNKRDSDLTQVQKTWENQLAQVSTALTTFPVGQGIKMFDGMSGNVLYGVVTDVTHLRNTKNPVSPASWKLKIAVVDGARELSLKFDKLNPERKENDKGLAVIPIETAYAFSKLLEEMSVYELFDDRQVQTEERRYLVAGQVLGTDLTGTFAQVTDNESNIHSVYLLNRRFDPDKDLDNKLVAIATPEQAQWFLFNGSDGKGELATPDGNLKIRASFRDNGQGLYLETPLTAGQGKSYFGDEKLLELTGNFNSTRAGKRSIMVAYVPSEKAMETFQYAIDRWQLGANSHKEIARQITGKSLSNWEACNTIFPVESSQVNTLPAQEVPAIEQSFFPVSEVDTLDVKFSTLPNDEPIAEEPLELSGVSLPSVSTPQADSLIEEVFSTPTTLTPNPVQPNFDALPVVATEQSDVNSEVTPSSRQPVENFPLIQEILQGWLPVEDWSRVEVDASNSITLYPADSRTAESISELASGELIALAQQYFSGATRLIIFHEEFSQSFPIALETAAEELKTEMPDSETKVAIGEQVQMPSLNSATENISAVPVAESTNAPDLTELPEQNSASSTSEEISSLIHPVVFQGMEWLQANFHELAVLGLGLSRIVPHVVETNGYLSQDNQRRVLARLEEVQDKLPPDIGLPNADQLESFFEQCPPGLIRHDGSTLSVHSPSQSNMIETLQQLSLDPAYAAFYVERDSAWVSKGQFWEFPLEAITRLQDAFPDFYCYGVEPEWGLSEQTSALDPLDPNSPTPTSATIPETPTVTPTVHETAIEVGDRVEVQQNSQRIEGIYLGPVQGSGSLQYDPKQHGLTELVRIQPDDEDVMRVFPREVQSPDGATLSDADSVITTDLAGIDPRSLSPILLDYIEQKNQHPEELLLYQVGGFYEAFGEDAITLSKALNVVVSSSPTPNHDRVARAGIPVAAIDHYQRRLNEMGYPAVFVDQTASQSAEPTVTVATPSDLDNPPHPIDVLAQQVQNADPHLSDVLSNPQHPDYSPSLQELRDWYASAVGLGKIASYLDHIHVIGRKFTEQSPQSPANPDIRNPVFSLNDRDRNYLIKDTSVYRGQIEQFRSMATSILTQQGQENERGELSFSGKTYQIEGTPNNFTVRSQDRVNERSRGHIFTVEEGRVAKAKINQTDIKKFKDFVAHVERQNIVSPSCEYS
jgi:predicted RNA methylase